MDSLVTNKPLALTPLPTDPSLRALFTSRTLSDIALPDQNPLLVGDERIYLPVNHSGLRDIDYRLSRDDN